MRPVLVDFCEMLLLIQRPNLTRQGDIGLMPRTGGKHVGFQGHTDEAKITYEVHRLVPHRLIVETQRSVGQWQAGDTMRLLLVCCLAAAALAAEPSVWTWRCESGRCVRRSAADVTDGMQLNTCKLTCGELSAVWPRPTGPAAFGSSTVPFLLDNVQFQLVAPDPVKPMLQKATDIFLDNLRMMQPSAPGGRLPGCLRDGVCPKAVADQKVNVVVTVEAAVDSTSCNIA